MEWNEWNGMEWNLEFLGGSLFMAQGGTDSMCLQAELNN